MILTRIPDDPVEIWAICVIAGTLVHNYQLRRGHLLQRPTPGSLSYALTPQTQGSRKAPDAGSRHAS